MAEHEKQEHSQHQDEGLGMAGRGVTRPMAEQQVRHHTQEMHEQKQQDQQGQEVQQEEQHGGGGHGGGHGHHHMSEEDRMHMLHMHHKQTLWVYWLVVILGIWTLFAPLTFDYGVGTVEPSGGRSVWLSLDARIMAMTWSDIISGLLLIVFGWRGLRPNRPVSLWVCCFTGVWLSAAPVLFWAPTAVAYYNGTLVGALVVALTVLVPGMPNMIMYMRMGGSIPPGWSYNPSSWAQRWILIVLGLVGWIVSRYLAAFQLGYTPTAWDPFFGNSTRQVLNSNMSHMWPISDGALGAFTYTFEFLMGWMGSPSRWRTMPWMVLVFGILVIPLGLVHIFLVISQPVIVGHWCTLCLLAAAIMLPMIPLEVDEVVAMFQHLRKARHDGESVWRAFWKGASPEGCEEDDRSPALIDLPDKPWTVIKASLWGMSFPWTLVAAAAVGAWTVFTPAIFGDTGMASNIFHLAGLLTIVVSVIAMGETIRAARFLNVLLGLILIAGPFFTDGSTTLGIVNGIIAGGVIIALSLPKGVVRERFGAWDRYVR